MTSPGRINWTVRAAAEANTWTSIAYSKGTFVAVASTGTSRVMTSPDGVIWTARIASENNQWMGVAYGGGGYIAVSFDGMNRPMSSRGGMLWGLLHTNTGKHMLELLSVEVRRLLWATMALQLVRPLRWVYGRAGAERWAATWLWAATCVARR